MSINRFFLLIVFVGIVPSSVPLLAEPFFHSTDSLAARDEWGLLHQSPVVYQTDFERRDPCRFLYYSRSGKSLTSDPAYVAALQAALARLGYYCGEPDGIFSDEVSDAIARLQKNYSMRVTGHLSAPVRRALFLP